MANIEHVIVLMLENRSFDSMLGRLYPSGPNFDGLTGSEKNNSNGRPFPVWTTTPGTPSPLTIPTPDPNELFADMNEQIFGVDGMTPMGGFVSNYSKSATTSPGDIMHGFSPGELPVLSTLARAFGVSDRWHASAPNQTWPNRFFLHTGTARGYVNNSPTHFPYMMPTIFNRLTSKLKSWRIYFHDMPQSATLTKLWSELPDHLYHFDEHFAVDAAAGMLPNYSFIEPRYFSDPIGGNMPNDQHPPHNAGYGEQLIAACYNAIRSGPGWHKSLFVIIYDEHGGLYDHVTPPAAVPPDGYGQEGFKFDRFGVRVPAVVISPWIPAGTIVRPPAGAPPFDHTSVIKTLRLNFKLGGKLTDRDDAAPGLMDCLSLDAPSNDGPPTIDPPDLTPTAEELQAAHAAPPNGMQAALANLATRLPIGAANVSAHGIATGKVQADFVPESVESAVKSVEAGLSHFLKPLM